jgi:hypothetical protein
VDNPGNRRRKVRELLFEQLAIEDKDDLFLEHEILWRGTRRSFQVIFGNVRELTTETLETKGGSRKLVIDFPFDDPGRTPADDLARLRTFRSEDKSARTLVWLPAFLSVQAQKDLGTLVKLDDILKSDDNFRRYASHLSAVEQTQARELLRNQRGSLRQRLVCYLEGAFGVAKLRAAIDEPSPMGLPLHAQNLIILVYADQANRSFFLHGGPYQPKLEDMPDELELREQALPSGDDWDEALNRAGKIFGISVSPLRNASNLSDLAAKLKDAAGPIVERCQIVEDRLEGLCRDWQIDTASCARHQTAGAVLALVQGLAADDDAKRRVEFFTHANVETSLDAMGTSYRKIGAVRNAIETVKWELFEAVGGITDDRKAAADGILAQLKEALTHDEYAIALQPRLSKLEGDAIRLLTPKPKPSPRPPEPGPGPRPPEPGPEPPPAPPSGRKVVHSVDKANLSPGEAGALLADLQKRLAANGGLRLDVSWTLYTETEKD